MMDWLLMQGTLDFGSLSHVSELSLCSGRVSVKFTYYLVLYAFL